MRYDSKPKSGFFAGTASVAICPVITLETIACVQLIIDVELSVFAGMDILRVDGKPVI